VADDTPDWELERMKARRQKKQLELNKFDCELRIVELRNELKKQESNLKALDKSLAEQDDRIAAIVEPKE
jgi:hypothetical protein